MNSSKDEYYGVYLTVAVITPWRMNRISGEKRVVLGYSGTVCKYVAVMASSRVRYQLCVKQILCLQTRATYSCCVSDSGVAMYRFRL